MVTIGVDLLLRNSGLYEHICLGNINKLYKSYSKCDDQQKYKAILEAAIVSNTEGLTYNSPMTVDM